AQAALKNASTAPSQIDGLIVSTCTGYLCPGLTSYLSERLALRPDVFSLDLVGQGCVAAVPNLRAAESLLAAARCSRVLSVCVEICSAAMYFDNDAGVLISACLFGDGAGAAVLSNSPASNRRMEWKASGSLLAPKDRDLLRFEQKNGMLRNILTSEVPALASQHAGKVFDEVLSRHKVGRSQVRGWVLHPGGREILVALRERLALQDADLRWSEAVLREYGNLSSASLYFVVQAAL